MEEAHQVQQLVLVRNGLLQASIWGRVCAVVLLPLQAATSFRRRPPSPQSMLPAAGGGPSLLVAV